MMQADPPALFGQPVGQPFGTKRSAWGPALAQAAGDLFISLHADTISNQKIRGASVYTLSEHASDAEAAAFAARENKADIIAGLDLVAENPEVANILFDLAQRETMNQSAKFANILLSEIGREIRLLRNTHRFAGFVILKAPDMPSVLIEMGYLSNPHEEKLLREREHQRKFAAGIVRAANKYFDWKQQVARQ